MATVITSSQLLLERVSAGWPPVKVRLDTSHYLVPARPDGQPDSHTIKAKYFLICSIIGIMVFILKIRIEASRRHSHVIKRTSARVARSTRNARVQHSSS